MMKEIISLLFVLFLFSCKEQKTQQVPPPAIQALSEVEEVTAAVGALLPAPHSFQLKQAKKWHDASGENWLVLYETGSYIKKPETGASAQLSAVLYQKTDSGFVEKWKMMDAVNNCQLNLTCSFYEYHLSVTDLDSNGIAEVVLVYALGCKADASANEKKLLLYEGSKKYEIRGREAQIIRKDTIKGNTIPDSSFANAPASFLSYARDCWNRVGTQKYE